ncbi:MAG TPA: hypothetical protein VFC55_00550, partial [Desulfobaccales bacterium]|nr:hypothetical protein [Desulfobaccales bacterium]
HQASVVHKSHGKSRSSAKASTKAASRTYAKQGKSTHSTPVKARTGHVVQASLFGTPSLAAKSSNTKKHKVALIGTAKGKKSGEARLAKKSNNTSKSTAKSKKAGSSNSRAKDKYSRSKSKRAIMVSEAR